MQAGRGEASLSGRDFRHSSRRDGLRRADRQRDRRHGVACAARQIGASALSATATATGHAKLILEIIERRGAGIDAGANLALSDSVTNTNVHETNYRESPCHMQVDFPYKNTGFSRRPRRLRGRLGAAWQTEAALPSACAGKARGRAAGSARTRLRQPNPKLRR